MPDLQVLEAAHRPWLMAPSSNHFTLISASTVTSPLTLTLPPPSYGDPCDYIGSTRVIQDNFHCQDP